MNLVIIDPRAPGAEAFAAAGALAGRVALDERRARHLALILRARPGDEVRVGLLGGPRGTARIASLEAERAELDVRLDAADRPARPPNDLIVAIPRPKQLKRLVQHATALGADRILLVRAWRTDPSYLGSPWLHPDALAAEAVLGLEQAGTTRPPQIEVFPLFKPFVEDRLPALLAGTDTRLVCAPGAPLAIADVARRAAPVTRAALAIGPERGFTPYEVTRLTELGFEEVHLGQGILRVETAVPVALAQVAVVRALTTGFARERR